jgi:hypothetical protein
MKKVKFLHNLFEWDRTVPVLLFSPADAARFSDESSGGCFALSFSDNLFIATDGKNDQMALKLFKVLQVRVQVTCVTGMKRRQRI